MGDVMNEILQQIKDTPLPTLLFCVGIAFVALGSIGGIKDRFQISNGWRLFLAIVGLGTFATGIALHVRPPNSEVRDLLSASTDYFDKWRDADKRGVLSYCHFPMRYFMDELDVNESSAMSKLGLLEVMTQRGGTTDLDAVTIACNFKESSPGEYYCIQIAYTYVFSSTPEKKRGARRQSVKWKNMAGEWKITEISEKDFPMTCKIE
jgi:hypothetical protein